jgi:hypothetical protein
VRANEEGRALGISQITSGSAVHTAVMKTEALKLARSIATRLTRHLAPAAEARRAPGNATSEDPHSGMLSATGAIKSAAATPAEIVAELRAARRSERPGRLIDSDQEATMERKKRADYF